MATKVQVWQHALLLLGKETILTTTDDTGEDHAIGVFTNAWPAVLAEAFGAGDWNFPKITAALVASTEAPSIGSWEYAYDYPDGYTRTIAVSPTGDFYPGWNHYMDQGGYIYSGSDPLYILYLSDEKMADVTSWPNHFWLYVSTLLAVRTCRRLTNGDSLLEELKKDLKKVEAKAKSIDARNQNNRRLPVGSWLRAHGGWGSGRRDSTIMVGQAEIVLGEGDV